jgi:hypothetical protein
MSAETAGFFVQRHNGTIMARGFVRRYAYAMKREME